MYLQQKIPKLRVRMKKTVHVTEIHSQAGKICVLLWKEQNRAPQPWHASKNTQKTIGLIVVVLFIADNVCMNGSIHLVAFHGSVARLSASDRGSHRRKALN